MRKILLFMVCLFTIGRSNAQWATIYFTGADFFNDIEFPDKNTGYVGGVWEIKKTTNGGVSWLTQYTASVSVQALDFHNKDTGYAVGGTYMGASGFVLKTTNGGATWVTQTSTISAPLYDVHFPVLDTGYAVGISGCIVKTVNGGANWVQQTSGVTDFLTGVHFINTKEGYAVGYNGRILKTTDGGVNWLPQISGTTLNLMGLHFTSPSTGYISGGLFSGGAIVLKTTNGGANWVSQALPTSAINLRRLEFTNANSAYAVGDNGCIIYTNNGGASWSAQSSGSTARLFGIDFPVQDTGYVVGEYKTILKYTLLPTGLQLLSNDKEGLQVYPNPSNGVFNLNLNKQQDELVEVYDAYGKLIVARQTGEGSMIIDLSNEPAGIYFVRVGVLTKKLVRN